MVQQKDLARWGTFQISHLPFWKYPHILQEKNKTVTERAVNFLNSLLILRFAVYKGTILNIYIILLSFWFLWYIMWKNQKRKNSTPALFKFSKYEFLKVQTEWCKTVYFSMTFWTTQACGKKKIFLETEKIKGITVTVTNVPPPPLQRPWNTYFFKIPLATNEDWHTG